MSALSCHSQVHVGADAKVSVYDLAGLGERLCATLTGDGQAVTFHLSLEAAEALQAALSSALLRAAAIRDALAQPSLRIASEASAAPYETQALERAA